MKSLSLWLKSIVLFFLAVVLFLCLVSYNPRDIAFLSYPLPIISYNFIGITGAYIGFSLFFFFGYASYFIPFYLFFMGLGILGQVRFYGIGRNKIITVSSFLLLMTFSAALIGILFSDPKNIFNVSGIIGFAVGNFFRKYLDILGSSIVLFLLVMINAVLLLGFFLVDVFYLIKDLRLKWAQYQEAKSKNPKSQKLDKAKKDKDLKLAKVDLKLPQEKLTQEEIENKKEAEAEIEPIEPEIKVYVPTAQNTDKIEDKENNKPQKRQASKNRDEEISEVVIKTYDSSSYNLPTIDLVKTPQVETPVVKEDIQDNIKNLEDTLLEFGVEAKVVSVQVGPVVTMYELKPIAGVKIQKISVLADDIALAMKSSSVRVVAPLPGRGTVGVEIPNTQKHMVYLREVLEDKAFKKSPSKLSFAIGKDVSGNAIIADIKEMPHLLIAGATGTGKTVCVNALICSILFKASPDEVKLILIDPKMVELAAYNDIPHLLHPIITDAKKAYIALSWAVEEMERRYRVLAQEGFRNIESYNSSGKGKLPYIAIIVDELADLMIVARESVETSIQRLAQLSRAIGIHLILATQRPSVDVITGVIKANFPARISFKVSSKIDSRTVLDASGGEKLLGKGDLLFLKPGAVKLIRAQGSYMDDQDIESLTNFLRQQGGPVYEQGILESAKKEALNLGSDELLPDAIKIVLQARQASASILQRRMRIGYTRAARLLDLMENEGVVGPFCGSKAREILVDPEAYLREKNPVETKDVV